MRQCDNAEKIKNTLYPVSCINPQSTIGNRQSIHPLPKYN